MSAKITVKNDDKPAVPSPGKETVYVDVDDDITTIIDKVEATQQKIVALVLPKRASVLQSVVNMRLLARSSEKAGKNIVLITSESALLPLAGTAGIHVAKSLQSKPEIPEAPVKPSVAPAAPITTDEAEEDIDNKSAKLDYHRSIGELAAAHADDEVITLDDNKDELPEPKEPKSSATPQAKSGRIKVPNFERFRLMMLAAILGVVGLIVFIILALFVLPKATVVIQTSSIPVSANLTLNASDKYTSVDEASKQIPASLKAVKQTQNQQVTATGQQNNGTRATGTATLTNCSNSSVTIPSGTGVSSAGMTFITQKTVSLDSGNFDSHGNCKTSGTHVGSVSITAQQGGSKYNTTFTGGSVAGYLGVTASGSASGGTDNNQTVVSQSDVDAVKQKLTSTTNNNFVNQFEQQLAGQGYWVLTSTLKAADPVVTASPDVGQPASNTTVTVTVTYTVLAIQKSDLRKIIGDTLNSQIDKTKQKLSNDDVLNGASLNVQAQTGDAAATLAVSEDTTAVPIIDIGQVKKIAAGQKVGDIKDAISGWPGVKNVQVNLSPFWVSKPPKNQAKIKVELQQVKA